MVILELSVRYRDESLSTGDQTEHGSRPAMGDDQIGLVDQRRQIGTEPEVLCPARNIPTAPDLAQTTRPDNRPSATN